MDDSLPIIDVEGKNMAINGKDVANLTTETGCSINWTQKPSNFSIDDEPSDDDSCNEDEGFCSLPGAQRMDKLERMKREFISLGLNTNRDPVQSSEQFGTQTKSANFSKAIKDTLFDEDLSGNLDRYIDHSRTSEPHVRIHKRYEKLGEFEDLIKNESDPFEKLSAGRVFKRRLTPGSGELISENSLVIYNCAFWTENLTEPYDSTWLRHNTIMTDLATDSILTGLRELLLTAKKGEWCEAFLRPEVAFGRLGVPPRIPPNATIFCLLEVVQVISKDRILKLSMKLSDECENCFEEFYAAADEARMRGNYYYDVKLFRVALQRYKSGIRILEALSFKDEAEEKKASALLVKLYNNTAKAANGSGDPRFALSACKQASIIDPREPKTHYNRMNAWKIKGHHDRALGVARRAMQLYQSDRKSYEYFRRAAEELKSTLDKQENELKELHRVMGRAAVRA